MQHDRDDTMGSDRNWFNFPGSKARFPSRKIFAKCEILLAKNRLLMRTKISPVLCEKISLLKNSVQLFSHFVCEIMIWPLRMQLMMHYRIPEMTESLVGKASNCFDLEMALTISSEKISQEYFTQSGN